MAEQTEDLNELEAQRRAKLAELREHGQAYPNTFRPQTTSDRIFASLCTPEIINAAEEGTWSEALWSALAEAGLERTWVPEDLGGVGVIGATLDGQPAALGREPNGKPVLFVEGRGTRELRLQLVSPLATSPIALSWCLQMG